MEKTYKVIYTGQKNDQFDREHFIEKFAKKYGTSEKAEKLLKITKDTVLKNNLSHQKASEYQEKMGRLGLVIRLDKMVESTLQASNDPKPKMAKEDKPPAVTRSSEITSTLDDIIDDQSSALEDSQIVNPYQAPNAPLEETYQPIASRIRRVPIGHGYSWVSHAFSNIFKTPFKWFFLALFYCLIMGGLSSLPYVGTFLSYLFTPFYMAGIMVGCQDQYFNEPLKIRHLFAGNSHHPNTLFLLGLIYTLCMITIMVVVGLMAIPLLGIDTDTLMSLSEKPNLLMQYIRDPMFLILILTGFGLAIFVYAAIWFAPALVALDGEEALTAMKKSVKACFKNILPMFWYSLVLIAGYILLLIPILITFILLVVFMKLNINTMASFAPANPLIMIGIGVYFIATLFIFIAITMSSLYASYRDIFYGEN